MLVSSQGTSRVMPSVQPQICFPARSQLLEKIRSFCQENLRGHITDKGLHRKLVLAIDEAVANVIEHGFKRRNDGEETTIELSLSVKPDRVRVRIRDTGLPFDPRKRMEAGDADLNARHDSIPDRSHRGYGLQLIRLIMDEIDYERTPKGENILQLTKHLKRD